jgi:hypothetical protein
MPNTPNKQESLKEQTDHLNDEDESMPERTEQDEEIISPNADTDLVEGDIRNDAVLAGEEGGNADEWKEKDEPKKMDTGKSDK